jgi:hypothetical protein
MSDFDFDVVTDAPIARPPKLASDPRPVPKPAPPGGARPATPEPGPSAPPALSRRLSRP